MNHVNIFFKKFIIHLKKLVIKLIKPYMIYLNIKSYISFIFFSISMLILSSIL